MSGTNSVCAALSRNISERDRARDVEQFDDIPRIVNEANKCENRFGKIGGEGKMLAVNKLMLESLLKLRFLGATMSYDENIIVDEVSTHKKFDTPMEIGMGAKDDGEILTRRRGPENHGHRTWKKSKMSSVKR